MPEGTLKGIKPIFSMANNPIFPKDCFFGLTLSIHRKWGVILAPCIINHSANKKFLEIYSTVTNSSMEETLAILSPEELEILSFLNRCNDNYLYKLFSRHKNIKEFIETADADLIAKRIRPYIEKQLSSAIDIVRNESTPIFLKRRSGQTLHFNDQLEIPSDPAVPIFRFSRGTDFSHYSLVIEHRKNHIKILENDAEIISNMPCLVRVDMTIYHIPNIEGTKLKPFFVNRIVNIPKPSEKKYYSTFVRGIINRHNVVAEGFSINESIPKKSAILTIEDGIKGYPVAILKFRYGQHTVFYSDKIERFTDFSATSGDFTFIVTMRDFQWESTCLSLLEDTGLIADDNINFTAVTIANDRKRELFSLVETISENNDILTGHGFILRTGSVDLPYSLLPVVLDVDHKTENDWFDLKAIVKIGDYSIPFGKLRKTILSGEREYKLPDGSFAVLPEEWYERYRGVMEMGEDIGSSIRLHKQHFGIFRDAIGQDDKLTVKLRNLYLPETLPEINLPVSFRTILRPYQKEGFKWLYFLRTNALGGCLADDMGLGKTVQVLALLQSNRDNKDTERPTNLIVVPASLVHNWGNEIKRFCPDLKILYHRGGTRTKTVTTFELYDIVIATYHIVRIDIDIFSDCVFDTLVLDESQHIKNPSSRLFKAIARLRGNHKIALSGTPVENSLMDLWSQLSFANPGILGTATFFKREYVLPIENLNDTAKQLQLKKIIRPFIMRRTKDMVEKELPPITEHTIICDMDEEQSSLYEKEKSSIRNTLLDGLGEIKNRNSAMIVLQGIMKLRQIANHPLLSDPSYEFGSGKYKRVKEDILNITSEGHKILIFSSFVKHLDIYADWLKRKNIGFSYLTGSTYDRKKVISDFKNKESNRIFLISLKAGGVGLNLTEADYVLILDPWWNPASEFQASSRSHRIGQKRSVFIYRYISEKTIEEKIQILQGKKSKLSETFISTNNPLASLDTKAILEIIG